MHAATASFTADPISVTDARSLVARALAGCPDELVGDAMLLTSELVSNAVLHAGTPFEVEVITGGSVRVIVRDGSPTPPLVTNPSPEATGGRGLLLVHTLASSWGYEVTATGKSVWFELES